ncbi:DNA/RNA nuclease SfsA [Desulfovibrio inopinatus]|uniref:DNA/RNA nuclease SfsA n=1 Tax=Desulfovibrio inopinatus TaxID=102109 RepID=UPI0004029384|nr:DNA/RNA nuclease SfsA [Desulfovibrio inopinatus]
MCQPDFEKNNKQSQPLVPLGPTLSARFLRRSKRFLVEVASGNETFWVHTNNSGSMLGLLHPGQEVLLSVSSNPKRKLPHTLEMVRLGGDSGFWVGVNTLTPNRMIKAAFLANRLPETAGMEQIKTEPAFAHGRLDALLTGPSGQIWIETKNVTMVEDDVAAFPDAVTERGAKHLEELIRLTAEPNTRAVVFYLIQRPDGHCFAPADYIDPHFAKTFYRAQEAGVEMWAYQAILSPAGIDLGERLPVIQE